MQSRLKYVEQNKGVYTPFNQQAAFQFDHEQIFKAPFEGYCMGVSLAYVEETIQPPLYSLRFFNNESKERLILAHNKCMRYQFAYEKNPYEYGDIFMRQYGECHSSEPVRPQSIEHLLDVIQVDSVSLINLVFRMQCGATAILRDHTIVIMHDGAYWRFFDPNYGEAKFSHKNHFDQWLRDEMTLGELQIFAGSQRKKSGILSLVDIAVVSYPYPRREHLLRAKL